MSTKTADEKRIDVLDLNDIMRTDHGRRFLLRQLEATGYFDRTFHTDPRVNLLNEGRRDLGVRLVEQMKEANPAQLANILKEKFDGR